MNRTNWPLSVAVFLLWLVLGPATALAENTVQLSCDKTRMTLDDVLQCESRVTVTDEDKVREIKEPVLEDFKVLGQGTSTSTEIQMVNLRTSQRRVTTTSYELQPLRVGTLRVGPAMIVQDGGALPSNVITVQVGEALPAPAAERYGADALTAPLTEKELSEGNLFLRLLPDKNEVTVGEQLTLSLYIYHWNMALDNPSLVSKPDFAGFWTEELELNEQNQTRRVSIGRRPFNATLVKRLALFPNQAGEIMIQPYRLKFATGGLFNRGRDLTRSTSPVALTVLPLPEEGRPAGFQPNNVGSFTLEAKVDRRQVEQFSPVQLTVTLSGQTNMGKIAVPAPVAINNVKPYPPTVTEDSAKRDTSIWGRKTAEYLLVPQVAGRFSIPPIRFSYFDTATKSYRTLETPTFTIHVTPSTHKPAAGFGGEAASKQTLALSAGDLRPIRLTASLYKAQDDSASGGGGIGWMVFAGLLLVGIVYGTETFVRLRRRLSQRAEARHAAAKATQRELVTSGLTSDPTKALGALQRYALLLAQGPTGPDLRGATREELRRTLHERGFDPSRLQRLLDLLEACDRARFMPGGLSAQNVTELWTQTQDLEREVTR